MRPVLLVAAIFGLIAPAALAGAPLGDAQLKRILPLASQGSCANQLGANFVSIFCTCCPSSSQGL